MSYLSLQEFDLWMHLCLSYLSVKGSSLLTAYKSPLLRKGAFLVQDMFGSVGVPQPGLLYRLESIPEMKYNALDESSPKGEICIKGPMVSPG